MVYTFWTNFNSLLSVLIILKLHDEKYLNSCEGKEYARRNLSCIYITLVKAKPLSRALVRVVLNF